MGDSRKTDLYHCTKSDALIAILESMHFMYSYCLEDHYVHDESRFRLERRAYAMVCFADLLEKEISEHMSQFRADSYIVMDKNWAMKNKISPVKYYFKGDLPFSMFLDMIKKVELLYKENENVALGFLDSMEIMAPFFKLYEGKYYIKGTNQESEKPSEFFLEREWRSIPDAKAKELRYLDEQSFINENTRNTSIRELKNRCVLRFGWDDILKIGCKEEVKDKIIHVIVGKHNIKENEALKKINVL